MLGILLKYLSVRFSIIKEPHLFQWGDIYYS